MVPSRRVVAALLCATVIASIVAVTATGMVLADEHEIESLDEQNDTYLSPPTEAVTQESYQSGGLSVSASAMADSEQLRGEYRQQVFDQRFATSENQLAVINQTVDDLAVRTDALDQRHASLIDGYSTGAYSLSRVLREMAGLHTAASQQVAFADRVADAADSEEDISLPDDAEPLFSSIEFELLNLNSPVTEGLAAGTLGTETSIYAHATPDALVLAASGETHIRQASLRNERNKSAPNRFLEDGGTTGDALLRAEQLYPGLQGFITPPDEATHVYTIDGLSPLGTFEAYLDGGTENVFHELQRGQSAGVSVTERLTASAEGVELMVETTEATGPMLVSVTEGGESVADAELAVDGWSVGTTDADGERWVVQPLAGAELTATVGDETVSITL